MEKRGFWIIAIILIGGLVLGIVIRTYFSNNDVQNSPQEGCKTLKSSPEGRVNIVFFAEKEQIERYSDFLLNIPPFNQTKDQLNFYYIDAYTPSCELYKETAILCYSKELLKEASVCPNDYLVVLKDEKRDIRSSSYMNVLSLNTAQPLSVFAHEFGHSFANLADEYTPATLPKRQENCKDSCTQFEDMGCFQGCSKDSYFRASSNGLMKTLSARDYGLFDSVLILKKLGNNPEVKITGKVIQEKPNCSSQRYRLIEGTYLSGEMKIISQSIQIGCLGSNGEGGFEYKLMMKDKTASTSNFNPELIFTDNEAGGEVYESTRNFYLRIPLIEAATSLEISLENKTISQINLFEEDSLPCQI